MVLMYCYHTVLCYVVVDDIANGDDIPYNQIYQKRIFFRLDDVVEKSQDVIDCCFIYIFIYINP